MTSSRFDPKLLTHPDSLRLIDELEMLNAGTMRCYGMVKMWYGIIDFEDLVQYFKESNYCCLPISLGKIMHKPVLKEASTP